MLVVLSLVAVLCLSGPASAHAQFTIGDVTAGEGDGQAPVTITDHGAADSLRCIALRLTPDPVYDLFLQQRCVYMQPGQREAIYNLGIVDDGQYEPNERYSVTLDPYSYTCNPPRPGCDPTVIKTGTVTVVDDDEPPPAPKPPRRPTCESYMRDRIGVSLAFAKQGLRGFGLRKLITGTGRGGLFTYLCGDGKARATVKYKGVVVAKGVLKGVYDDFVKARGPVRLRPTDKAGRLRGLSKATLKLTLTLFDSDGKSLARTATVTVTAAGRSGGGDGGRPL